jgi:hypothetical protein
MESEIKWVITSYLLAGVVTILTMQADSMQICSPAWGLVLGQKTKNKGKKWL